MTELDQRPTRLDGTPATKPGRAPKLNRATADTIVNTVSRGQHLTVAAQAAGIHKATLMRWLAEGSDARPGSVLRDFHDRVRKAQADAEIRLVDRLMDLTRGGYVISRETTTDANGNEVTRETYARPDRGAITWYLERAHPDRWGPQIRGTGPNGSLAVDVTSGGMNLAQVAERLAGAGRDAVLEGQVAYSHPAPPDAVGDLPEDED